MDLEITSLSHEGRGVAHIDGKVCFVDGALDGEKVSASYVRKRSQFDELKSNEVERPSADRVEPLCSYAAQCGGCSLQHMDSKAQIGFKQSVLFEQLQHATGMLSTEIALLPSLQAACFHYRRKARLAVRMVAKKGGALVGFREKYSSFITDMDDCKVLVEDVAALIRPLRELITGLVVGQAIPQIEVAVGEIVSEQGAVRDQVALIVRHLQALGVDDTSALIDFARQHNIELYLQGGGVDSVHKIFPDDGVERLQYFLPDHDLTMQFHPMDFTQINAQINRQIISQAIELLELDEQDVVLDLFCGLGNFTLPIARRCSQVVGVEGSEEMVIRGTENAALNEIGNANFFAANLCDSIEDKAWVDNKFTKVLLDPPRSGALEIVSQVARLGAQKIVYVSCNPATLARDAAQLISDGYILKSAGVMDMFPHTAHVESMAVFELRKKN